MDAPLLFDVLLYINGYYFAVFGACNFLMWVAKYFGPLSTPDIATDVVVQVVMYVSEMTKMGLSRKLRDNHRGVSVAVAFLFAAVSLLGILYIFIMQDPILKLEIILDTIMLALLATEVMVAPCCFFPCCKKPQY